ncbi:MAG: 3-oxoacyl-[acyl-carrier-protein] synthase III C-terminal domain-containing protein [Nanoarchaeota archaeon]
MPRNLFTIITGTGSYIPSSVIPNSYFLNSEFYDSNGNKSDTPNQEAIDKCSDITKIEERRYAEDNELASDLGRKAAVKALDNSKIDSETLDYIIFAQNFGDIDPKYMRTNQVPNLATRVKKKLGIKNRKTESYDIPFGCPGWVQGLIVAHRFFQSGDGKRAIVIGAETLSRVADSHDRDSMIYSDGAGAVVLERVASETPVGILSYAVDCGDSSCVDAMGMGESYGPNKDGRLYFKMRTGHDVFEYAVKYMPGVIKESIDKAGLELEDITKIAIHQANERLDHSVVKRLFKLYGTNPTPDQIKNIMPMIISWLANNSVATCPTVLDLLFRGELNNHSLDAGDNVVITAIGAGGPNINSLVYKMPFGKYQNS